MSCVCFLLLFFSSMKLLHYLAIVFLKKKKIFSKKLLFAYFLLKLTHPSSWQRKCLPPSCWTFKLVLLSQERERDRLMASKVLVSLLLLCVYFSYFSFSFPSVFTTIKTSAFSSSSLSNSFPPWPPHLHSLSPLLLVCLIIFLLEFLLLFYSSTFSFFLSCSPSSSSFSSSSFSFSSSSFCTSTSPSPVSLPAPPPAADVIGQREWDNVEPRAWSSGGRLSPRALPPTCRSHAAHGNISRLSRGPL